MMEAMIPSLDGMSLWTLQKNKRGQRSPNKIKQAKDAHQNKKKEKNERKREGTIATIFFHTCASK